MAHKHVSGFFIDAHAYGSQIRDWDPNFKVGFSVMVMLMGAILNDPCVSAAIIFATAYVSIVKGGLPLATYLSVLTMPFWFVLLGTVPTAVDVARAPAGEFTVALGAFYLNTTAARLTDLLYLILKVFAAISALQMMALSTPSYEIIEVLRKLRCPKLIIELMYLIYRFIFILVESHRQMKDSAEARLGYCDFKTSCVTFSNIAGNLLIVSLKKANAYYNAMESRCYEGDLLFIEDGHTMRPNCLPAVAFILFLMALWWLGRR